MLPRKSSPQPFLFKEVYFLVYFLVYFRVTTRSLLLFSLTKVFRYLILQTQQE